MYKNRYVIEIQELCRGGGIQVLYKIDRTVQIILSNCH